MSTDQMLRAADQADDWAEIADRVRGRGDLTSSRYRATARLFRATAAPEADMTLMHDLSLASCRRNETGPDIGQPGACIACLMDDFAATYLGEEPQP